jgi:hypothetical protein
LITLLVAQLFAIFPTQALASSELTSSVFSPWVSSSVPYDGGVSPINENKSEGLVFSCPISPTQVALLFQTYQEAYSENGPNTHFENSPSKYLQYIKKQNLRPTITAYLITDTEKQETLMNELMHSAIGGCFSNEPVTENLNLSITEIIHPITFFTKLVGAIVSAPLVFLVNTMEPVVFRSLFTTPHTALEVEPQPAKEAHLVVSAKRVWKNLNIKTIFGSVSL